MPQPPKSEKTPLGPTQSQPQQIYLKPGKIGHILPTPAPTKTEVPPQIAAIPYALVLPKQVGEKFTWGLHCPICIKEEEEGTGGLE